MSGTRFTARAPLVGREREQALLRDHLAEALGGHGSLVLIAGEAGIGKTTLAEGLCQEASAHDAVVLIGRCYDLTETPPYGPWVELFADYQAADGMPLPAAFAEHGTIGSVTSQATLFQQILDFLKVLVAHRPVVLLLDDLHWADPASLDLLRYLARSLTTVPLLLIATYRVDELTRRHPLYALLPRLVREARAERLDLRPLIENDVRALLGTRYRLGPAAVARLLTYLQERTEGNPFFLGELLRTLEEAGALQYTQDGWVLGAIAAMQVPPLLRQVIDGRLARLDESAQMLLAVAAVIGQEVPLSLWAAAAGVDEETLVGVTERALEAHLLETSSDDVRFTHALIREALFEGTAPPRRRALHRRIGEVLTAAARPDPDAVAYHFQRAGDTRALMWLIRAGERALALFADRAAAQRLEAALALLDAQGLAGRERGRVLIDASLAYRYTDPPRALSYAAEALRAAEAAGDRLLTMGILRVRGWLHNDVGRLARGLDDLLAAQALMDALSDAERADTPDMPYFFAVPSPISDSAIIEYLAICGEFARVRAMGERLAADLPDVTVSTAGLSVETGLASGNCHQGLMLTYMYQGEPARAARAAVRARAGYESVGFSVIAIIRMECLNALAYAADRPAEWRRLAAEWDSHLAGAVYTREGQAPQPGRSMVLAAEGRWGEARAITAAMLDDLRRLQRHTARLLIAGLDRACGETGRAWEAVREVLPEGPTAALVEQYRLQEPTLRLGAELALDEGDLPTAAQWLGAHDDLLTRCAGVLGRSEEQALWARYHRQSGGSNKARNHAERALAHASDPRQPLALLAAHRLLGELDTESGRFADAAHHLDASLALADACAMPYEQALTLLARAELFAATGDNEAATKALDETRTILEWLGARPALARAEALTASLLAAPAVPAAYPDGLSAREIEVLHLIATGKGNQEIGDMLSISVRTVERHITNLYAKIGAHGRADATAYALHHWP